MARFLDEVNRVVETVCAVLMIVLTVETVYVIVMRYIFNDTPSWGEIISRFLMVYACMFGFSIGMHDDSHVRINAFDQWVPAGLLRALDWFGVACMTAFSAFMIVEGIRYTVLCGRNTISGLNIRSSVEMICIPIGGLFCLLQSLRRAMMMGRKG